MKGDIPGSYKEAGCYSKSGCHAKNKHNISKSSDPHNVFKVPRI